MPLYNARLCKGPKVMPDFTFGPVRVFVPISVRHDYGFYGGPIRYEERTGDEDVEPIIVDTRGEASVE